MKTASNVIRTQGLSKRYDSVKALKSLDLNVPKNSIFGFLGPNGAGKSTAIKLLLGLIHPTAGGGEIFGMDIVEESLAIRQRVGYLAQHPRFYEHLTPRETLRFVARFFYADDSTIERKVDQALDLVQLSAKADRKVKGFSGGEMQRLGIAQAQINEPDLLILDEPASALDPMGREQVLAIMEQLREQATIFYSTHILDDVQRVSDQVAILDRGQLIAQGSIEALLNGGDGIVYSLATRSAPASLEAMLRSQPWVSSLTVSQVDGLASWKVGVSDDQVAEKKLLRLVLADERVRVVEYGREKVELEDVFIQLVKKGHRNGD
jgi:ABC-2 type transport system ATP-binding protein